jgi:TusA-related sulfurtransferase
VNTIDARGYSCPEPVLMTKKAYEKDGCPMKVLVDNKIAVGNLSRYAFHQGLKITIEPEGEDFALTIEK